MGKTESGDLWNNGADELKIILGFSQVLVADAYNLSYLGGWDWEDLGSRPAQANSLKDPHLQNNQREMD
jgi:hypothetical protein